MDKSENNAKTFSGNWSKLLTFSTVNTIRLPVQPEKWHLRAGEASVCLSQRSLRYDPLI